MGASVQSPSQISLAYIVRKYSRNHNIVSGTRLNLDLRVTPHRNILKEVTDARPDKISSVDVVTDLQKGKFLLCFIKDCIPLYSLLSPDDLQSLCILGVMQKLGDW